MRILLYESNLIRAIIFIFEKILYLKIFNYLWRCLNISSKELQINESIRDPEVRLINSNGNQEGIVPIAKALAIAEESGLDLVKIAGKANPPVCKIMDYGKYKFEIAKKEKEAKKNQRVIEIKEVRLSLRIADNDFNTKVNYAKGFADAGNKIKVSVRFKGREKDHPEIGYELMEKFKDACKYFAGINGSVKVEGRSLSMILDPQKKINDNSLKKGSEAGAEA